MVRLKDLLIIVFFGIIRQGHSKVTLNITHIPLIDASLFLASFQSNACQKVSEIDMDLVQIYSHTEKAASYIGILE